MPTKKTLYIVRHAKSSWDYENISDLDRPLKIKGIRNAYEMARRLKIGRNVPDYFISSPAARALHTATIFLTIFEGSYEKFKIDQRLYAQGSEEILKLIKSQPANVRRLMIFGHNPDFSELVRHFTKQPFVELPTCGIAVFTFDSAEWSGISKENVKSELFEIPKKE